MSMTQIAHRIFGKIVTTDFDVVAEGAPAMAMADYAERGFG